MRFKPIIRKKYVPVLERLGFEWVPIPGGPVEDFRKADESFYIRFGVSHMAPSYMYADYIYADIGLMFTLDDVKPEYLHTNNVFYKTQDELNAIADSVLEDTTNFYIPAMQRLRPHVVSPSIQKCYQYCNTDSAAAFAEQYHFPWPDRVCDRKAVMQRAETLLYSWAGTDIAQRTNRFQQHEAEIYGLNAYLGEWECLRARENGGVVGTWQWIKSTDEDGNIEYNWAIACYLSDEKLDNMIYGMNPIQVVFRAWNHYPYYWDSEGLFHNIGQP